MSHSRLLVIAVVVLTAVTLAACGSSKNASTKTTGTSAKSAASASSGGASSVDSFATDLQKGKRVEFDATYESRPSNGQTTTFRVAQKKPKSLFETTNGDSTTSIINDGTTTYVCSKGNGNPPTCIKEPGTSGSNSVAAPMLALVDPGTISTTLRAMAHVAGVNVNKSSKTVAGKTAQCVSVHVKGQGANNDGTWCVIDAGVLAYVETGGTVVELTKFATDVSASTFDLPGNVQSY